ncbi:MAG: glycosyltransferase family 2 protein [Acidobacteriota bacterium]
MVDVTIITVSTDEAEDLERCLPSILGDHGGLEVEIVVVDNASTDRTAEILARHPDIRVLRRDKRYGYIENNNLALPEARGRYILSMNADVVLEPGTLAHMVRFMDRHPEAAVSACRLHFGDGDLQLTCRRFPTPLIYLARLPHFLSWLPVLGRFKDNAISRRYDLRDEDHTVTRPVDWVITAFFLMRRSAVEEIGVFSHRLRQPFYLEDVEWCFRARLAGYLTYYVGEVWATHFYRQSSIKKLNRLSFVHLANTLIFFRLHGWSMLRGKHRRNARLPEARREVETAP